MQMLNCNDIRNEFKRKLKAKEYRVSTKSSNETRTLEIQNAVFIADEPYIIRPTKQEWLDRELEWYKNMSLNVNDIPGGAPKKWKECADTNGYINSNYGWMVFSKENYSQYDHCLAELVKDTATRQATMLFTRPSMWNDAFVDTRYDFCCTYAHQCFLNWNQEYEQYYLDYSVIMRSNDAIFGYNSDANFAKYLQTSLCNDLQEALNVTVVPGDIIWNAMSLHVYESFWKYLED